MSIDLTTTYGNLALESPVVIGSCPMSAHELTRIGLVTSGAGAIVLPSLFEEQVVAWNRRQIRPQERHMNASSQDPRSNPPEQVQAVCEDAQCYLKMVRRAKAQVSIPVIASLNGRCGVDWLDIAVELQAAGAAGIEWHVSKPLATQNIASREIEDSIIDTAKRLDEALSIPFFLKLNREYTSVSHLASRMHTGKQGLVLFGRSPEVDIGLDSLRRTTHWGLTQPGTITQSLDSIMQVRQRCQQLSLAASGGIGCAGDVIKSLLAGADVAMVTSAVYREGPSVVGAFLEGLLNFMERHHIQSIEELKSLGPQGGDTEFHRTDDINAMSAKPKSPIASIAGHTIQGDRWGHTKVPR